MPGSASDYLEAANLKDLFQITAYTKPTMYVGLLTTDPAEDASALAEPVGNAYARVQIPAANWAWDATNKRVQNSVAANFPNATGAGWGVVTHWALFDALTAGNMLIYAPLDVAKTIGTGDGFTFGIAALKITQD